MTGMHDIVTGSVYMLNDVMGKWKHYPSNSEPPPSGTVYCQLSLVSKVSCSLNPKLRNWYNINIEYCLFTQTSNFSDLKIITSFQAVILFYLILFILFLYILVLYLYFSMGPCCKNLTC